jgi:hypothetical protein
LSESAVTIHELIVWQLDEYSYRDSGTGLNKDELSDGCERAKRNLIGGVGYEQCSALLSAETAHIQDLPDVHAQRRDLRQEHEGLDWTLGVVDLHYLLAFQRRLVFRPRIAGVTDSSTTRLACAAAFFIRIGTKHYLQYDNSRD